VSNNLQQQLQVRASMLTKARSFFAQRHILEVETPLLAHSTNPAPHLNSFITQLDLGDKEKNFYLQTSPEFAMKRLLANGSGDIYQICKAFRNGEIGRIHNPEFTILEWYRVGFTHLELMQEVSAFLCAMLQTAPTTEQTYQQIFQEYLQFNPLSASLDQIKNIAQKKQLELSNVDDKDTWLQLLFSHFIEPHLGKDAPAIIYNFPASQAMLARLNSDSPRTAARFEVYFHGVELANGFYELNDAEEQRQRFVADLEQRKKMKLPAIPLDEYFLAALPNLPDCAGVALGFDRLLLLAANANHFNEVLSFPMDH
jgi:elongation factor P--(R)-beta-lysine ligase